MKSSFSPSKIQEVIIYLVEKLDCITRVKLAKLIYMSDWLFFQEYGASLTGVKYVRRERGPVPVGFEKSVDSLNGKELDIDRIANFGMRTIQHRIGPKPRFKPKLTPQEKLMVENVLRCYGNLPSKVVAQISYQTPPMAERLKEEKQVGQKLIGKKIVFEETIPTQLLAKFSSILTKDDVVERGNAEELASRDLEIYESISVARDRANLSPRK